MNIRTVIFSSAVLAASAFSPAPLSTRQTRRLDVSLAAKGFGDVPQKKVKSEGQVEREKKAASYDEIAATGGQEYNIFVRQFGGEDDSWLPCGSVAVQRQSQPSDAIFGNEEALRNAIVRMYPKLQGFEMEFEYGFNLKVYPDDPVEVAKKLPARQSGLSVGNWISTLLSPIDASKVPPPPASE